MITGHRSIKNCLPEISKLVTMAVNLGVTNFLCGMALGVDQCAAELLIMRGLKWTAVIPCADQDKLWRPHQRSRYRKLLDKATDQVILYSEYSAGVMHARNLWMIKRSQICLAYLSSYAKPGGTRSTVQMALDRSLLVYRFDPEKREYSMVEPPWKQLTLNLSIND
ncbi:SLOG family protein [Microcoleus sp. herbarium14]|uniref:SLOG family protein n=1 Tax=Microcoleus sp. herbarium14 TaxID=3055439 RepID=UPI002FD42295